MSHYIISSIYTIRKYYQKRKSPDFTDDVTSQDSINRLLIGSSTDRSWGSQDIMPEIPRRLEEAYGSYDIYDFDRYADHESPQAIFHQGRFYGDYCDPSNSRWSNGPSITSSSYLQESSSLAQFHGDDCAISNLSHNNESLVHLPSSLQEIGSLETQEPVNDYQSDSPRENSYRDDDNSLEDDAEAESSKYDSSDSDSVSALSSIPQSPIVQ
ncbi:hypothetical protein QAD02_010878 [Eretmocerus hayati]|uniref:Uncharacterized protein n=1 Tax=Eretmocerus hayati TaxID=131215 RepID=A0ACC2NVI1_9HYME|nr:hypothetical protein QAD02_010878 [Eretmocerus hayati]